MVYQSVEDTFYVRRSTFIGNRCCCRRCCCRSAAVWRWSGVPRPNSLCWKQAWQRVQPGGAGWAGGSRRSKEMPLCVASQWLRSTLAQSVPLSTLEWAAVDSELISRWTAEPQCGHQPSAPRLQLIISHYNHPGPVQKTCCWCCCGAAEPSCHKLEPRPPPAGEGERHGRLRWCETHSSLRQVESSRPGSLNISLRWSSPSSTIYVYSTWGGGGATETGTVSGSRKTSA